MISNICYLLALHSIYGLGPIRLKKLIDYYKDPKLAWQAERKDLITLGIPENVIQSLSGKRKDFSPESYLQDIKKKEINFLTIYDDNYPYLLSQIYDPPVVFYYKGQILEQDKQAIAIVGSRKMTGYGKVVTWQFAKNLAEAGLTIVSGLARGVDSCAHRAATFVGGRTIAVLGGGINQIYPPENLNLAAEIINGKGAVISEFSPDEPSLPGNFPSRNRIISGISMATLVTEADEDSGSLITARLALEQNREVFAVPGPITSALSKGPIGLIKQGAFPASDADEILEQLNIPKMVKFVSMKDLSERQQQILGILRNESLHIDEICRNLNLSVAETSSCLLKMEISGLIRNLGSGTYCIN